MKYEIPFLSEEQGEKNPDQTGNTTTITGVMDIDTVVPYTMDELEALYSSTRGIETRTSSIIRAVTATISIIASSTLIWMISRSEKGFGSIKNRLLLGLCISDIIFSLSLSFCNLTAPASDAYITWNARGNMVTCEALGFLSITGFICTTFYHTSLNIFYLLVLKFEKSEEYIRTKIERYFHGGTITLALGISIFSLVKGNLNHNGNGVCNSLVNDLPHCIGYEAGEIRDGFETPCYRGADTMKIMLAFLAINLFVPPIVIAVSMTMIYRSIKTLENRMSKFGAATFRARIQERENNAVNGDTHQSTDTRSSLKKSFTPVTSFVRKRILCQKDLQRFQSRISVERRTMMNKALAYAISFFLTIIMLAINPLLHFILKQERNYVIFSITNVFLPLQGLYNFMIYSHPKAMNVKSIKKVGYLEAMVDVVMYKYEKKTITPNHRGSMITMRNSQAIKQLVEVDEEEKCEIQPFEEEGRLPEEDEHFLQVHANPSAMDNICFPISAEKKSCAEIHSNSLNVIEDDGCSPQSLDISTSTDANIPPQKNSHDSVYDNNTDLSRSSMGL